MSTVHPAMEASLNALGEAVSGAARAVCWLCLDWRLMRYGLR